MTTGFGRGRKEQRASSRQVYKVEASQARVCFGVQSNATGTVTDIFRNGFAIRIVNLFIPQLSSTGVF